MTIYIIQKFMKKFILLFFSPLILYANQNSIKGDYLAPSNKVNSASIIRIYKKENGKYAGKIIYLINPEFKKDINNKNKKLKNRSLVGINILDNFIYDKKNNLLINGTIYNPENGKYYYSSIKFKQNSIYIRGALDKFLLFGETRIWNKYNKNIQQKF